MKNSILSITLIAISTFPASLFSKGAPASTSKTKNAKEEFKANAKEIKTIKEKLETEIESVAKDAQQLVAENIVAKNLLTFLTPALKQMIDFFPKLIDGSINIQADVDKISKQLKCLASEGGECAAIGCKDKMECLVSTWSMLNKSLEIFVPNLLGEFDKAGKLNVGVIPGFLLAFMPLSIATSTTGEKSIYHVEGDVLVKKGNEFIYLKDSTMKVPSLRIQSLPLKSSFMKQIPGALLGATTGIINARNTVNDLVKMIEAMNKIKKIDMETVTPPPALDPASFMDDFF